MIVLGGLEVVEEGLGEEAGPSTGSGQAEGGAGSAPTADEALAGGFGLFSL